MYCPVCRAEFREGFYRCVKCDVDLVESQPSAAELPAQVRSGWTQRLLHLDVEKWLKTGAFIYVGVEALGAVLGNSARAPFLSMLTFMAGKILSAVMWGLVYYGVGEIVGLLRKWLADGGVKEDQ